MNSNVPLELVVGEVRLMSISLLAACAQAAGVVAVGYLLKTAALVNDGDVQVSMRMPLSFSGFPPSLSMYVQHVFNNLFCRLPCMLGRTYWLLQLFYIHSSGEATVHCSPLHNATAHA